MVMQRTNNRHRPYILWLCLFIASGLFCSAQASTPSYKTKGGDSTDKQFRSFKKNNNKLGDEFIELTTIRKPDDPIQNLQNQITQLKQNINQLNNRLNQEITDNNNLKNLLAQQKPSQIIHNNTQITIQQPNNNDAYKTAIEELNKKIEKQNSDFLDKTNRLRMSFNFDFKKQSDFENKIYVLNNTISNLKETINQHNNQTKQLKETIDNQKSDFENKINQLNNTIDNLKETVNQHNNTISNLEKMIHQHNNQTNQLKETIVNQKSDFEKQINKLNNTIDNQTKQLNNTIQTLQNILSLSAIIVVPAICYLCLNLRKNNSLEKPIQVTCNLATPLEKNNTLKQTSVQEKQTQKTPHQEIASQNKEPYTISILLLSILSLLLVLIAFAYILSSRKK